MKLASPCVRSFRRQLSTLLLALAAGCIFAGFGFQSMALSGGRVMAIQSRKPVLHVEVDLQPVDVQVKDAKGNDVTGLSAKDFTVLENGQRQKISFFDAGGGPVSIAILVDLSSSMNSSNRLGSAQEVAAQFMHAARPEDEISTMEFSDEMGPYERLTSEQLQNPSGTTLLPAHSRGSAVYDAIATALCHLRTSKNLRQAVIVITDGVDEYSRIDLQQLIGLVHSSRAQLFMVGLQSKANLNFQRHDEAKLTIVSGQVIDNPEVVFDRLMKESGAESFIPKSDRGLREALAAVSNMLQSEYTLAYYPQKNSGKARKIEVKVDRRGAHVLTRHLIDSQEGASQLVHFDEGTCVVSPKFHPYPYEANLTNDPGGMTYRENFTNPHSGWPVHQDSHYVSGGYELSSVEGQIGGASRPIRPSGSDATALAITSPTGPSAPATIPRDVVAAYGPWWINFRVSVNVKPDSDSPAGLVFRMNDLGYYALLITDTRKDVSAELVKFEADGHTQSIIVPWTTAAPAPTSEVAISIEAVGDHISIYVEGQKVRSLTDDSFAQGLVGFVLSGHGHAIFRSLVVQQE
jgi:Ca-activated chloride channel homolog